MTNIILICVDQMRADTIRILGNPSIITPNLDALSLNSVVFSNHFSAGSPCSPARTSLLTGQYPATHGSITKNHRLKSTTNLALEIKKIGLSSTLFGFTDTVIPPYIQEKEGIMPGFDVQCYMNLHNIGLSGWAKELQKKGYHVLPNIMDIYRAEKAPYNYHDSDTAFLTDQVINYVASQGQEFGFIHLSYFRPHPPFIAPAPYSEYYPEVNCQKPEVDLETFLSMHPFHECLFHQLYKNTFNNLSYKQIESILTERFSRDKRAYYGLITELDYHLGRLITFLKDKGVYDETLLIFTSDHGELLGDKWLYEKGGYFDQSFHVPLLIKPPKALRSKQEGKIVDSFTSSIDLMPTILDIINAPIPESVEGLSLAEMLSDGKNDSTRKDIIYEHYTTLPTKQLNRTLTIKDESFKYVYCSQFEHLLFDLKSDPDELKNLATESKHLNTVAYYQDRLRAEKLL